MRTLRKGESYFVLQKKSGEGSIFISGVKSPELFSGNTVYGWKLRGVEAVLGPYKSLETAEARAFGQRNPCRNPSAGRTAAALRVASHEAAKAGKWLRAARLSDMAARRIERLAGSGSELYRRDAAALRQAARDLRSFARAEAAGTGTSRRTKHGVRLTFRKNPSTVIGGKKYDDVGKKSWAALLSLVKRKIKADDMTPILVNVGGREGLVFPSRVYRSLSVPALKRVIVR